MFSQTDFAVRHKIRFKEKFTLVAEFDILNLFNEDNVLTVQNILSTQNVTGSSIGTGGEVATIQRIFNGGIGNLVKTFLNAPARPDRRQATFGQPNSFQDPREFRFGFRLIF